MRLAFVDPGPLEYDVDSPGREPLGGSESAMCYLMTALSHAGHEVYFLKGQTTPHWCGRVRCLPFEPHRVSEVRPINALIVLNAAGFGSLLRLQLGSRTPLVLWIHQAPDQPVLAPLLTPEVRHSYDGFACVSRWHAEMCAQHFKLDRSKLGVMLNAVAPWFENLFPPGSSILEAKSDPPVLAYTSTPYRGLDRLLNLFPSIRSAVPGTRLKVYSSMKVYQMSTAKDMKHFGTLYERCRSTEGVEYQGSVSQMQLAQCLREATLLAYPNTYAETSCIAALEAMAAGCRVVSSQLAALPETTAGFAELIPAATPEHWDDYDGRFVSAVVRSLNQFASTANATPLEAQLQRQVEYIRDQCIWARRASSWSQWIAQLSCKRQ